MKMRATVGNAKGEECGIGEGLTRPRGRPFPCPTCTTTAVQEQRDGRNENGSDPLPSG